MAVTDASKGYLDDDGDEEEGTRTRRKETKDTRGIRLQKRQAIHPATAINPPPAEMMIYPKGSLSRAVLAEVMHAHALQVNKSAPSLERGARARPDDRPGPHSAHKRAQTQIVYPAAQSTSPWYQQLYREFSFLPAVLSSVSSILGGRISASLLLFLSQCSPRAFPRDHTETVQTRVRPSR